MPPRPIDVAPRLERFARETYIPQGIILEQDLKFLVVFFCNS